MVSNETCQNFCDKRLARPGSKHPIWQRSQPIGYKTKFSQRDNICLVDFKYNITYQNGLGETNARLIFIPSYLKYQKSYLTTYMDELSTKSCCLL